MAEEAPAPDSTDHPPPLSSLSIESQAPEDHEKNTSAPSSSSSPSPSPSSSLDVLLSDSQAHRDAEELRQQQSFVCSEADPATSAGAQEDETSVADADSQEMNRKPPLEDVARGIACIMGPVMNNFDAGVEGCLKSQSILASSIDRLTRELDKLLEDAPLPFAMQHATKLSSVRSRVASLSASLRIVQKRMENIDRLLAGYATKSQQMKIQPAAHVPSATVTELFIDVQEVEKDMFGTLSPENRHNEISMEASNSTKDTQSQDLDDKNEFGTLSPENRHKEISMEASNSTKDTQSQDLDEKNELNLENIQFDSNQDTIDYLEPTEASNVMKSIEPE